MKFSEQISPSMSSKSEVHEALSSPWVQGNENFSEYGSVEEYSNCFSPPVGMNDKLQKVFSVSKD